MTTWQDAVEDAVHDAAAQHGLTADELLDVTYDDDGEPDGTGVDFVQRLDSLADVDPNDETFARKVADEVAAYAAELHAEPIAAEPGATESNVAKYVNAIDFLGRFREGQDAGLSPEDAQAFAASGLSPENWRASRSEPFGEDDIERAAGHDVTPGHDELHHWWVYGPGRARWETWTELYTQLLEHVSPEKAERMASAWFEERHGYAAGSDLNRVKHGKPPRGDRVGPG